MWKWVKAGGAGTGWGGGTELLEVGGWNEWVGGIG